MENNNQGIMAALGYPLALPQQVVPVTNTKSMVQRTQYNPNKLKALMDALGAPKKVPTAGELIANALVKTPEPQTFTGGFGEQIIDPWTVGLSALMRSGGDVYGARAAAIRDADEVARENAIKAAQIAADADKRVITDESEDTHIKVNTPNSKEMAAVQEQIKNVQTLDALSRDLEDIGTRFDNAFKNIDDMQNHSTRWGRLWTNGGFGVGTTTSEKLARDQFNAWKGSMKNVLVNANRQAGSGSMSDADAARYEQNIGEAKTPAEARNILQSFQKRMMAPVVMGMSITPKSTTVNGFTIETIE